ncbi:MAG: hypothetical protein ACYSUI_24560, partial [Planctomycetota bacterium]
EECDCHTLEGDDITDLSMKFPTNDVVEMLQLNDLPPGALVPLVLSGNLWDGTPFTSPSDCIRLVPPGTPPGMLAVESNMTGAWIDVSPPDIGLDGGGFADFERTFPLTTVVTLTTEPEAQGRPFVGWLVNGVLQSRTGSSGSNATSYQHPVGTVLQLTIVENERVRALYAKDYGPTEEPEFKIPPPGVGTEAGTGGEPGIGSEPGISNEPPADDKPGTSGEPGTGSEQGTGGEPVIGSEPGISGELGIGSELGTGSGGD